MKKTFTVLCFTIFAGAYLAAQASSTTNEAVCRSLSSEISGHATTFLHINDEERWNRMPTNDTPEKALRSLHTKEIALQNTSQRIWSLRTRMTNLNCAQADTFVY